MAAVKFRSGQHIRARRSGHGGQPDALGEVIEALGGDRVELYRVRWQDGVETWFVPGPETRSAEMGPGAASGPSRP